MQCKIVCECLVSKTKLFFNKLNPAGLIKHSRSYGNKKSWSFRKQWFAK